MDDVDHTVDEPDLAVRADYEWGTLSAADVGDDPVVEVRRWLAEVRRGARAQPVELRLTRDGQGWRGSVVLALGGGG